MRALAEPECLQPSRAVNPRSLMRAVQPEGVRGDRGYSEGNPGLEGYWRVGPGVTDKQVPPTVVTPCLPLGPTLISALPSQSHLSPLSHPVEDGWIFIVNEGLRTALLRPALRSLCAGRNDPS